MSACLTHLFFCDLCELLNFSGPQLHVCAKGYLPHAAVVNTKRLKTYDSEHNLAHGRHMTNVSCHHPTTGNVHTPKELCLIVWDVRQLYPWASGNMSWLLSPYIEETAPAPLRHWERRPGWALPPHSTAALPWERITGPHSFPLWAPAIHVRKLSDQRLNVSCPYVFPQEKKNWTKCHDLTGPVCDHK